MPSMDWEDFQRDHHRPHVLIVSMEAKKSKHALAKADFNRLILRLGSVGNYAIKAEGTTMYIAFEDDADANRLASILRPERTTREPEWASKSWATIDGATHRRERSLGVLPDGARQTKDRTAGELVARTRQA